MNLLSNESDLPLVRMAMNSKRPVYVFDLDGVVFRGGQVIPDAPQVLSDLRRRQHRVFFVSNQTETTRSVLVSKLRKMGIECELEEVLTAAHATALYLRKLNRPGFTALVIGTAGLADELRAENPNARITFDAERDVDYVVVGLDRQFTYQKLSLAFQAIAGGARLIAAHRDAAVPVEGRILPGPGAIVAAIEAAGGARAQVVGKPEPFMLEAVLERGQVWPSEVILLGDSLRSDIEVGKRLGLKAVLVLTGVSRRADVELLDTASRPDYVLNCLTDLYQHPELV